MFSFDELLGQENAKHHLRTMLLSHRVPHALLFVGPSGVGKATAAHLFAAIQLCEKSNESFHVHGQEMGGLKRCGTCSSCTKIDAGTHPDLLQVKTEENSFKISLIRDLQRSLQLLPSEGHRRIVVLHDVEKMTEEAQNALLKTLEEPPRSTTLILVTSRPKNLLPTVRSRCQSVQFFPLELATAAKAITQKIEVSEAQAEWIVAIVEGSIGRALEVDPNELLKIRKQVVDADLGLNEPNGEAAELVLELAASWAQDKDALKKVLFLYQSWLRDQIVLRLPLPTSGDPKIVHKDLLEELQEASERRPLLGILRRAEAILETSRLLELPNNYNPQMLLEQMLFAVAGFHRVRGQKARRT